jgi:hypothetical protein
MVVFDSEDLPLTQMPTWPMLLCKKMPEWLAAVMVHWHRGRYWRTREAGLLSIWNLQHAAPWRSNWILIQGDSMDMSQWGEHDVLLDSSDSSRLRDVDDE